MKIKNIVISNYRVLDGVSVSFDEHSNYIVGKNNVGKTCMLDLLDSVFNGKSFEDSDFFDVENAISIDLKIKLTKNEYGIFDDNFSVEEEGIANLNITQKSPDDPIQIQSIDTNSNIYAGNIKKANIISHSSNIKPLGEFDLTFRGRDYNLIPELVKQYTGTNPRESSDQSDYDKTLVTFLNKTVSKLDSFQKNGISVGINTDYEKIITRSLAIQSKSGIDFSRMGFGIQFSSLVPLKIIDKIIYWKKYNQLEKHLITQSDGKKVLNIILTLDEPEVHLHPNLQVQTMSYIRNILNGLDSNFNSLLKEVFDIDTITGQTITVTHSPNIFSSNYKEIIRFTNNNDKVLAVSGNTLTLNDHESKQLKRQFPYFADALFADGVILVEGDTEQTAIPIFALNLDIDLVANNVNVVRTDGVQSIPSLRKLLKTLHINNVCIIDSDGDENRQNNVTEGQYVTDLVDFEFECFEVMTLSDINHYLADYYTEIKAKKYMLNFWMKSSLCKTVIIEDNLFNSDDDPRYIVDQLLQRFDEQEQNEIKLEIKKYFIDNYLKNKSIVNGGIIASNISVVPHTYSDAISAIVNE